MAVSATMRLALAATAAPSIVVVRSHASITSHCCGLGSQTNFAHAFQRLRRTGCAQSSSGVIAPGGRHFDVGGHVRGVAGLRPSSEGSPQSRADRNRFAADFQQFFCPARPLIFGGSQRFSSPEQ
jgi:hypothetical protein